MKVMKKYYYLSYRKCINEKDFLSYMKDTRMETGDSGPADGMSQSSEGGARARAETLTQENADYFDLR